MKKNIVYKPKQFIEETFTAIHEYAAYHDWNILLQQNCQELSRFEKMGLEIDGMIADGHDGIGSENLTLEEYVQRVNFPVVCTGVYEKSDKFSIVQESAKSTANLAIDYFINKDVKKILFVSSFKNMEHYKPFDKLASSLEIEIVHFSIADILGTDQDTILNRHKLIRDEVIKLLNTDPRIGIFTHHDKLAREVSNAIHGIKNDKRIFLLGKGNPPYLFFNLDFPVTSIRIDQYGIGYTACEVLDSVLSGDKPNDQFIEIEHKGYEYFYPKTTENKDISLVKEIEDYVYAKLKDGVSITMVCDKFDLSSSHLTKLFKTYLNVSPGSYMTTMRINHAKHLLANTNQKVKAIAFSCGYSSSRAFGLAFTRDTGMTAIEYRESL